jgi:hypothetical protein
MGTGLFEVRNVGTIPAMFPRFHGMVIKHTGILTFALQTYTVQISTDVNSGGSLLKEAVISSDRI